MFLLLITLSVGFCGIYSNRISRWLDTRCHGFIIYGPHDLYSAHAQLVCRCLRTDSGIQIRIRDVIDVSLLGSDELLNLD